MKKVTFTILVLMLSAGCGTGLLYDKEEIVQKAYDLVQRDCEENSVNAWNTLPVTFYNAELDKLRGGWYVDIGELPKAIFVYEGKFWEEPIKSEVEGTAIWWNGNTDFSGKRFAQNFKKYCGPTLPDLPQ